MKAEELRALQKPLKERYEDQPQAALITLEAQGQYRHWGSQWDSDPHPTRNRIPITKKWPKSRNFQWYKVGGN